MARNKTLVSLLDELRAECRHSLNPAHNNQVRDTQIKHLQRVQELLWEDFAWPHLRVYRDIPIQAGERYYSVPEDLDLERIEKIELRYNGRWVDLDYGIDQNHLIMFDSDTGIRGWPVRRWRISEDLQIEVWPIADGNQEPTTLEGTLRVWGIRNLKPLVADGDRCDLDGRVITLYAAAEMITDEALAAKKLSLANKLLAKLRGHLMPRKRIKMFNTGQEPKNLLRGPPTVYYRTSGS